MNKIQVEVLNPQAIREAEKLMVLGARLTQRGHKVQTMADLLSLYEKPYGEDLVDKLTGLPHPTIQKFGTITIAVVGASRRFLAQITRHQNEVKFMSASLQYSNYSGFSQFVVPYSILEAGTQEVSGFLESCERIHADYKDLVSAGLDHDDAGYLMPQALRNVLLISATPYQWKHMIGQRICRRNTPEMRYVMLRVWERLYDYAPIMFSPETTGAFCQKAGGCQEGAMWCGHSFTDYQSPAVILKGDFPLLVKENNDGTSEQDLS